MKFFVIFNTILLIVIFSVIFIRRYKVKHYERPGIKNNYIMKFVGGTSITYIYNMKNTSYDYGYKYINLKEDRIVQKGDIFYPVDIFNTAERNHAFEHIVLRNGSTYTIEEFRAKYLNDRDDL